MDALAGLVREFLSRNSGECPVLVLTGSRCCGKTAALRNLKSELDQHLPYVLVDCAAAAAETPELLTALAYELNNRCAAYGRLSFPRLLTGRLVMSLELDQRDPAQARGQVRRALEDYRRVDRLRTFIASLAASALRLLPPVRDALSVDDLARYFAELLMRGLLAGRHGREVVLGPGQNWYGHQDRGLGRDPFDALVDLNRRAARLEEGSNRQLVAEMLWAAFLADLHADFADHPDWDLNCAVLLDNADAPGGFLDELSQAREVRRAAHHRDAPLTVIATSRGAMADNVLARGGGTVPLRDACFADYQRRCAAGAVERGWYPVLLPNLTEPETRNLVAAVGWVTDARVSPVIFEFTGGHPGATYMIIEALRGSADPADLATVLAAPAPRALGGEQLTVGERLLRSLTDGLSEGALKDLTKCAAARDMTDTNTLAADSDLLTGPRTAQDDIFARELWPGGPADGSRAARTNVMLPVLRRLLLQRLAASPADWHAVHDWLKGASAEAGGQYYTLALGEVKEVTTHLSARLSPQMSEDDAIDWLEQLDVVTAAPRASAGEGSTGVTKLVSWADPKNLPTAAVGALVVARWLLANSLSAHHRRGLYTEIAASLDAVAPFAGAGRMVFRADAEKYRRLAARG